MRREEKIALGVMVAATFLSGCLLVVLGKPATQVATGGFVTWCALGSLYFLAVTLRFYSAKKDH